MIDSIILARRLAVLLLENSRFLFGGLTPLDQVVDEPNDETTAEDAQDNPEPKQSVRTNVFWRKHWFCAARTVLACCILTIRVKAIRVTLAAIAHTYVRLRVETLEIRGASVVTGAPAADTFFTASRGAI